MDYYKVGYGVVKYLVLCKYVIRFLHKCQHSKKKLQNFVIIDNNGPQTFQKILLKLIFHIENRLNSSDLFSFIDFSL